MMNEWKDNGHGSVGKRKMTGKREEMAFWFLND